MGVSAHDIGDPALSSPSVLAGGGPLMLSVEGHDPISGLNLDRCAEEQVQIIGHIQPYGLLFALSEPDLLVKQVSANVATFLGVPPESVLDRSFEAILGAQQFEVFRTQLIRGQEGSAVTLRLPVRDSMLELEWQPG